MPVLGPPLLVSRLLKFSGFFTRKRGQVTEVVGPASHRPLFRF